MKVAQLRKFSPRASHPRIWLGAAQALGVFLIVLGVVVSNRADAIETSPFDKYPGLGRSPAAGLRDNTIAAWEAFRREQLTASCMERSGFTYVPAVEFPSEALVAVAKGLGVSNAHTGTPVAPWQENARYVEALSEVTRDGYYRALLGESAADAEATKLTGELPEGRGADFAQGGCAGDARAAVPGIWTLKRDLSDELDAVRADIAVSTEIEDAKVAYSECARRTGGINANGPGDLDVLAARGLARPAAIARVAEGCNSVWANGYRGAERTALRKFESRNADRLGAAQERYRDAVTTVSKDQSFRSYLAQHAWGE